MLDYRTKVYVAAKESKSVAFALNQVGKEYEFGAVGPNAFDCSGLVLLSLRRIGLSVPHFTGDIVEYFDEKHALCDLTMPLKALVPGDVIFYYGSLTKPQSVSHCALYVGRNSFGHYMVVAAVDEQYGVKKHRMRWALNEIGYGLTHLIKT